MIKKISLKKIILSTIITSIVLIGVFYVYNNSNKNVIFKTKINSEIKEANKIDDDEEIFLGDTCSTQCSGYYSSSGECRGTESKVCTWCSAGKKLENGECKNCTGNTYSEGGSTTCYSIPNNSTVNSSHTGYDCNAGYYKMSNGRCGRCTGNKYSYKGATSCTNIPAHSTVQTRNVGFDCNAGYRKNGDSCTICSAGTYSAKGATSCTKCSAGESSEEGASKCTECNPGQFNDVAGGLCRTCGDDQISTTKGSTSCTDCEEGKTSNANHTACTCQRGSYEAADKSCVTCPIGHFCAQGNMYACGVGDFLYQGIFYYQDEKGQDRCKSCEGYNIANDNQTGCVTMPVTAISTLSRGNNLHMSIYLDKSESAPTNAFASFFIEKTRIVLPNTIVTYNLNNTKDFAISTIEDYATLEFKGKHSGSSGVEKFSYSISSSTENTTSTGSYSGDYHRYNCDWASHDVNVAYTERKPLKSSAYYHAGCDFFEGEQQITSASGTGYRYTKFWSRCCHQSAPASTFGGCYGDEPYIGIATEVEWNIYDKPLTKNGKNLKFRYDNIRDGASCTVMASGNKGSSSNATGDGCNSTNTQEIGSIKDAGACEGPVSFETYRSEKLCADLGDGESKPFYSISCKEQLTTDFDLGDDKSKETNTSIDKGLGVKLSVGVKTRIVCNATFDAELWKESYNRVMNKLKTVKSRTDSSYTKTAYNAYQENDSKKWDNYIKDLSDKDKKEYTKDTISYLYEQYNLGKAIEEIVKTYNNYKYTGTYDEEATGRVVYKANGDKNESITFTRTVNEGTPKTLEEGKKHQLGVSWLTNPVDYTWINVRKVEFNPEKVYLDRHGDIVTSETEKIESLDGGEKIYLEYNISTPQDVGLEIEIKGVGSNKTTVSNKECTLCVPEDDASEGKKYRQVDVDNPFINNDWEKNKKGQNWTNNMYDFTNAIDKKTWEKEIEARVDISGSEISDLQSSNARYFRDSTSPYLGLCDDVSDKNPDAITRKVCNALKGLK